jgi:uncharacterized protein (TIGR02594 family)
MNYKWLNNIGLLPRMVQQGLALIGTREVIGKGSNRTILEWRDNLNQNGVKISGYSDDDIPWCGLFVAHLAFSRLNSPSEVPESPLWARNWASYGTKVKTAMLGDVLVFARNGGGHVGLYIAEDATAYHVLGGNQSNAVSIARIEKSRCIAICRPKYNNQPESVKQYVVASSGELSKNEQ